MVRHISKSIFGYAVSFDELVLISKSYSDITGQLPANNSSLRPRISLDGSTIVFHSRASDLVPGDSNGKEDIFLYRIATNTLLQCRE